jgi:hypothetical protein
LLRKIRQKISWTDGRTEEKQYTPLLIRGARAKLKSQSQKRFKERKYQYVKWNGHVKIIGYRFGAKFKLVFRAKYDRGLDFRLLGNIETFELDKYYKLFPDLIEKIH